MGKEKTYCVYKHTNKINGKIYIGQTCQKPEKRWNNGEGYKDCTYFYSAIQTYGWDNFDHEILFEGLTLEEANVKEKELIAKYTSNNKEYGYNLMDGGFNSSPNEVTKKRMSEAHIGKPGYWTGKHRSEETKEKIRKANIGYIKSQETREKLSKANKGKIVSKETGEKISKALKGKKLSEEHRQKLSEAKRGEKHPNWGKRGKEVPTFGRKASEETKQKISNALKGRKLSEATKEKISRSKMGEKNPMFGKEVPLERKKKFSKPVKCIETGIIYYSLREAERQTGISKSGIKKCCEKEQKTAGKLHWEYVKE